MFIIFNKYNSTTHLPSEELELSKKGKCTYIPSLTDPLTRYIKKSIDKPTTVHLNNTAGTNARDVIKNTLDVVIRGGKENRYYTIRRVHMVVLKIKSKQRIALTQAYEAEQLLGNLSGKKPLLTNNLFYNNHLKTNKLIS